MTTTRFLLILLFGSLACLTQADPTRIQAVQDLANAKSFEAWNQIFSGYEAQPNEVKREIQKLLPRFSDEFDAMLKTMPERTAELSLIKSFQEEVDARLSRIGASSSKKDRAAFSDASSLFMEQLRMVDKTKPMQVVATILEELAKVLDAGSNSPEPEIRKASLQTLFELPHRYQPIRPLWPDRYCIVSPEDPYHILLNDVVTSHIRKSVPKHADELVSMVEERREEFDSVAIALAEQRIPAIRPMIGRLLKSKAVDEVFVGHQMVAAWPVPEAFPLLVAGIIDDSNPSPDMPLLCYGERTPTEFLKRWPRMSVRAKKDALGVLIRIPCRASLEVVRLGAQDRNATVRQSAANTLRYLPHEEWDTEYAGADPGDFDYELAEEILNRLIGDADPEVRSGAIGAYSFEERDLLRLAQLIKDPSPSVRIIVGGRLCEIKSLASVDLLWSLLSDQANVREYAIGQLRGMGEVVVPHARKGLRSSEPFVRQASIVILGNKKNPERIDWIKELAADRDEKVRDKVWGVLADFEDDAVDALVEIGLKGGESAMRRSADALLEVETDEAMRGLGKLLASAKGETRSYLLEVQVKLRSKLEG